MDFTNVPCIDVRVCYVYLFVQSFPDGEGTDRCSSDTRQQAPPVDSKHAMHSPPRRYATG